MNQPLANCDVFLRTGGEHESKTLRQLQAEQDDEDRFQADLEQAMRQSLGRIIFQICYQWRE